MPEELCEEHPVSQKKTFEHSDLARDAWWLLLHPFKWMQPHIQQRCSLFLAQQPSIV